MKIFPEGKDHSVGDASCSSCYQDRGRHFPEFHRDALTNCVGLMHSEMFPDPIPSAGGSQVMYRCDRCGDSI
jgi:hypothetical protein